jgi:hypothetical protein
MYVNSLRTIFVIKIETLFGCALIYSVRNLLMNAESQVTSYAMMVDKVFLEQANLRDALSFPSCWSLSVIQV